jgi:hypothetical protein
LIQYVYSESFKCKNALNAKALKSDIEIISYIPAIAYPSVLDYRTSVEMSAIIDTPNNRDIFACAEPVVKNPNPEAIIEIKINRKPYVVSW